MQTIKDIIKVLPFEDAFKEDLFSRWDQFTPDQRFRMERIIWRLYDSLFEIRLAENIQLAFERAKKNEEKLDHEFYARVRKQTAQDLAKDFSEKETTEDLSDAREELQKILAKGVN